MATAPKIFLPGSTVETTTALNITTNIPTLVFTGLVDDNTVDILININDSGYIADPSLVSLNLPFFTIPNSSANPNGFRFNYSTNTIKLKAVDINGSLSDESVIVVDVKSDSAIGQVYAPPSGVNLQRAANSVVIEWSGQYVTNASGFNIYAATGPGGAGSSYLRVNSQLIPVDNPTYTDIVELDSQSVSYDFSLTSSRSQNLQVILNTVDAANNDSNELVRNVYPLIFSPSYKVDIKFSRTSPTSRYRFVHNRNATQLNGILNSETFALIPNDQPLYYVVTACYYNKESGSFIESRYSQEMPGSPLPITQDIKGLKIRDQSQVARDYIQVVQQVAPELSLIPGSTIREVHVEPFSNEIQKTYFLLDFVHRAKSFPALLAIDDPTLSGTSIPVSDSAYKINLRTALATNDDVTVQSLINSAFDSLAANYGIVRQGPQRSVVEQIFYTTVAPVRTLYVNQNAVVRSSTTPTAPRFIAKGLYSIPPQPEAARFYNPAKKRYEVKVQMYADTPGLAGNVPANTLDVVETGANGFLTINESGAIGGSDNQSNLDLATAAMQSLVGVDSGTRYGIEKIVSSVPGVLSYYVVDAGNQYMMRDYDPLRRKHIGGKVDIYVKGSIDRTVIETFAFEFDIVSGMRFQVIDPVNLIFVALDSRLTPDNPIAEMLYNPSRDQGLRNFSSIPVSSYDLSGVVYIDYRTIKLNTSIPQPDTAFDDFVQGDYRFRSNNKFTPTVQPIVSVSSVVGQVSGALDNTFGYTLYKLQDPLYEGESVQSTDYVSVNQYLGQPSGSPIQVNGETHVLVGTINEALNSVGINRFTLRVYSEDRTVLYSGPDGVSPDYLIVPGTQTSPLSIVRTALSSIPDGSTVSIDYEHDENFAVTYVVNDVLQRVNDEIDAKRHITADILVKQAIENPLYIETTIVLKPNSVQSTVDINLRTSYSNAIDNKNVGEDVHVSDVIASFDNTDGVNYIVTPFNRMTLADGSYRAKDSVASDYVFLPSISAGVNAVYLLTQPLPFATSNGGGPSNIFHSVYKDSLAMENARSVEDVSSKLNQSYIIGSDGAIIPGFSDDETLSKSHDTALEIINARKNLTANRILVSLDFGQTPPDVPTDHAFAAAYVVSGDTSAKDVYVSNLEYLTSGDLTITYKKE